MSIAEWIIKLFYLFIYKDYLGKCGYKIEFLIPETKLDIGDMGKKG